MPDNMIGKVISSVLLSVFLLACHGNKPSEEPLKKANIPATAFWVGGVDGGNWYLVESIHAHKNNAFIKVYSEDGELLLSKRFIVICSNVDKPVWLEDPKSQILSFDGSKIYLKAAKGNENCWLQ